MSDDTEDISLNFGEDIETSRRRNIRWVIRTTGRRWHILGLGIIFRPGRANIHDRRYFPSHPKCNHIINY